MDARDLLIAPLVILVIYGVAFLLRPYVTYEENRKYFFPALTLKFLGALGLGVLYQFYYGGGDTFGYYTHGASHIFDAFLDQTSIAFKLIFYDNNYEDGVFKYASRIWMYRDSPAYMVVRIAGILAINHGMVPPTINHFTDDPGIDSKLNLTFNEAQERKVDAILSNTFGFGGHNSSVIFKRFE